MRLQAGQEDTWGTLQVTVHSASELGPSSPPPSPYVELQLERIDRVSAAAAIVSSLEEEHDVIAMRTEVASKTAEPVWRENSFCLPVSERADVKKLVLYAQVGARVLYTEARPPARRHPC